MKPALALIALLACACSVDKRSSSLECTQQADCAAFAGTICSSGYCVDGTLPIDAAPPADAFECPASCNGGCDMAMSPALCTVNGAGTCPDGFQCKFNCTAAAPCGNIDCGANRCELSCSGAGACGTLSCADGGTCIETCGDGVGSQVCGAVTCTGSGDCTRTCSGDAACGTMTCASGTCAQICPDGDTACGQLACGSGKCTATCGGVLGACDTISCGNSCQCDIACDDTSNICPTNMTCPQPPGGQDQCENTVTGACTSSKTPNKCQKCM